MAQAFCRFGSKVSILFRSDHIMPKEDPEAALVVEKQLIKEGVDVIGGVKYKSISLNKESGEKTITIVKDDKEIEIICDEILISTGRSPNIEGIGLDIAGIDTTKSGVLINDFLQTTNSSIYAVGDCCYKYQFTHAADFNARIVIRNSLFFGRAKVSDLLVPWYSTNDVLTFKQGNLHSSRSCTCWIL
jgi:pyruvate/2-oxoglutarate dehydrogenase complex dihydrolipoamide dehydrogenase (E3) component